jgi:hypothetical protein
MEYMHSRRNNTRQISTCGAITNKKQPNKLYIHEKFGCFLFAPQGKIFGQNDPRFWSFIIEKNNGSKKKYNT